MLGKLGSLGSLGIRPTVLQSLLLKFPKFPKFPNKKKPYHNKEKKDGPNIVYVTMYLKFII